MILMIKFLKKIENKTGFILIKYCNSLNNDKAFCVSFKSNDISDESISHLLLEINKYGCALIHSYEYNIVNIYILLKEN